ncbi:hypothetical protein GBA65_19840 [Rubrobacter marinus]|uniref:NlpC/P60 domain-containing protein n=1 Tax=Rubrobacter marinus TaxID=2653852 RepID=A0A6G8Q1N1_9ACTN|nr:NlpC/P60 family protein [Rubrobacter marinus]QIN80394.1 hypothetical protein GBA65_19840 [Rubrobacter marinus]
MRRIAVVCMAVLAAFAVFATVRQDAVSETYSQVVDNSDKGRFAASKSWKKSDSGKGINGDDYLFAAPAKKGAHALFEVAIPNNGLYAVYVRWPEVRGLNDRAPVGVETPYGTKWTEVDQRKDGGKWVRIGEFEMRKDEKFPIRISHDTKGKGNVAADAVKVEKVSSYEQPAAINSTGSAAPSEGTRTTSATGADVARKAISMAAAFKKSGVKYRWGTCTSTLMSCTCFTKKVYANFGITLPMDELGQSRYGRPISKSALRAGDLVYFKENGLSGPITHVGVYVGRNSSTGQQMISHMNSYWGTTVTSEMRYIRGYAGARRLV